VNALKSREAIVLEESLWLERRARHERRVREWTDPHQARAARGESHPVHDFLFTYYGFRPAWLRRWHSGPDVILAGPAAREYLRWPAYRETDLGVIADPELMPAGRREFVRWLRELLVAVQARPALYGCNGLHEWAMVYRQQDFEIRHAAWPLRLPQSDIERVVQELPLRCTHFDAFRFFTPEARPLNRLQPTRESVPLLEQRGCLHANMDLYKWAYKLAPFGPSELLADCFELARDIREIDMRASPYDLRGLGFEPIAIETPEGRVEYENLQRAAADRAAPLRTRLIALCDRLLED